MDNSESILRPILMQNFLHTNIIIKIGTRMYWKYPLLIIPIFVPILVNDEIRVWRLIEVLVQLYAMNLNILYRDNDWDETSSPRYV